MTTCLLHLLIDFCAEKKKKRNLMCRIYAFIVTVEPEAVLDLTAERNARAGTVIQSTHGKAEASGRGDVCVVIRLPNFTITYVAKNYFTDHMFEIEPVINAI